MITFERFRSDSLTGIWELYSVRDPAQGTTVLRDSNSFPPDNVVGGALLQFMPNGSFYFNMLRSCDDAIYNRIWSRLNGEPMFSGDINLIDWLTRSQIGDLMKAYLDDLGEIWPLTGTWEQTGRQNGNVVISIRGNAPTPVNNPGDRHVIFMHRELGMRRGVPEGFDWSGDFLIINAMEYSFPLTQFTFTSNGELLATSDVTGGMMEFTFRKVW